MMKILVTGGLGYVGAAVSHALVQSGHRVVAIDDLTRNSIENSVSLGYETLPISISSEKTYQTLEEFKPDMVVHCAASAMVEEGERKRADYFVNNVVNHTLFLSHLVRAGVRRIIYSSTAAVYAPSAGPVGEESSLGPTSWYGWTKLIAERVIKDLAAAGVIEGVIFRYFSVVGSAWGILENRSYDEHALTRLLKCAETGEEFVLNGADHRTRDGSPIRDFVTLKDIAHAHVLAAEQLYGRALDGLAIMNLGTGRGITILELRALIERVSQRKIQVRIGPHRPGDPSIMLCSYARAVETLGWQPRHQLESELEILWRVRRTEGDRDIPERALHRR